MSIAVALAKYCKWIHHYRLSPGTSGNVSCRDGNTYWITPTGSCLGELEAEDMVQLSATGEVLSSGKGPSSEWPMHYAIYKTRSDVGAVVHAHPPKASALAALNRTIEHPSIAESIFHLGDVIPLVPYCLSGSTDLATAVQAHAQSGWAMILANHGVLTLGTTIAKAYYHLELLENLAEIQLLVDQDPKGPILLQPTQIQAILATRMP